MDQCTMLPQPPSHSPSQAPRPSVRSNIGCSPSKSRIPSPSLRQEPFRQERNAVTPSSASHHHLPSSSSSSILASINTPSHSVIKRRTASTGPTAALAATALAGAGQCTPLEQQTATQRSNSPEAVPAPADDISPTSTWLGVPEPSPSPRCMQQQSHRAAAAASKPSQRSRIDPTGSTSPPVPIPGTSGARLYSEQHHQQQQQQGQLQRAPARETRATALRRSAVEAQMRGGAGNVAGKSGSFGQGTFGSRPLNAGGAVARSVSNVRDRPASASSSTTTPPPPTTNQVSQVKAGTHSLCVYTGPSMTHAS